MENKSSYILHKNGTRFIDSFRKNLSESESIRWAVAFASYEAYKEVRDEFRNFFKSAHQSRAVFDVTQFLTDPALIEELATYPGDSQCKIFFKKNTDHGFMHHKMYLFKKNTHAQLIIGSNNFTKNSFYSNEESSVMLDIPVNSYEYGESEKLWDDIWNSPCVVSPIDSPKILEKYTYLYHSIQKNNLKSKRQIDELLSEFANEFDTAIITEKSASRKYSYLAGLIVASLRALSYEQLKEGTFSVVFKNNLINRDNPDQGFYAARINNQLLGNVRIDQKLAIKNQVQAIADDIANLVKDDRFKNSVRVVDKSKKMIIYNIEVTLDKNSTAFKEIYSLIFKDLHRQNQFFEEIPNFIYESNDHLVKRNFIRGYFDCRGRISEADRFPGGPLRVAFQISTGAESFGNKLTNLLSSEFKGINAKFASGKSRDKDNLIRFQPNLDTLTLANTNWKKILLNEFVEFNKQFS